MKYREILGIDFGGSGIKAAPIDVIDGKLLAERQRIETPARAEPDAVARVIRELVGFYKWTLPVGIGFPSVVQRGVIRTAANISEKWIGMDAATFLTKETNCSVHIVNDADAAGYAEMKFGAGENHRGVVLLITVGTGIGTVIFSRRKLIPNSELGHIILPNGQEAEKYASDAVRKKLDLSWDEWGARFNDYLTYMQQLFWPDLIIIGGGISRKLDKFMHTLKIKAPVVPAKLLNEAGMIGAAVAARKTIKQMELSQR